MQPLNLVRARIIVFRAGWYVTYACNRGIEEGPFDEALSGCGRDGTRLLSSKY